jgi:chorismate mutase/prephenate dehydratase
MNNKTPEQLLKFREEIDKIDNQIIDLLGARAKVVMEVGKYKKESGEKFFIRANREADMIKKLVTRADQAIPKSLIVSIWRKIISSANILEQDLKIAVHNPNKSAEFFYFSIQNYDSVTNMIAEIERNQIQIAIFALPALDGKDATSEQWWTSLANNNKNIRVFAKIPFIENQNNFDEAKSLVAVAIKEAEKSDEDKTLLTVEVNESVAREEIQSALKKAGFNPKILKTAKVKGVAGINFHLIEIDGFFQKDCPEIQTFAKSAIKPFIRVLGNYPAPIKL